MAKNIVYENGNKKVLIIGLGQLGLPVAKYIKDNTSFDVYGYDISQKAMERAEKVVSGTNMMTTITFDNLEIDVPRAQGPDGRDLGGATWKINGKLVWTTEAHKAQDQ